MSLGDLDVVTTETGLARPPRPPRDPAKPETGGLSFADLRRVTAAAEAAFSPNTVQTYRRYSKQFMEWLEERRDEPHDGTVAAWLADRYEDGLAPSSLKVASSSIGAVAKAAGQPDPRGELSRRVLAGLVRKGRDRGRGQAAPLRRSDALAVARLAARDGGLRGVRDAALILLMSDALLRRSEAAAILVGDLGFSMDGSARLRIRFSKTDQEGRGAVAYLTRRTTAALREWLTIVGDPQGELDRRVDAGLLADEVKMSHERWIVNRLVEANATEEGWEIDTPLFGITAEAIYWVLKRRAAAAGLKGISGHSARIGSAQSLTARGAELQALMRAGRWKNAGTAARYVAGERASRGAVAQLFEDQ